MKFEEYTTLYHANLINEVIPFCMKKSGDKEFGSYLIVLAGMAAYLVPTNLSGFNAGSYGHLPCYIIR
ncbi:MAG: hypothetical protein ABI288_07745 [Ginsengibacter sp.]